MRFLAKVSQKFMGIIGNIPHLPDTKKHFWLRLAKRGFWRYRRYYRQKRIKHKTMFFKLILAGKYSKVWLCNTLHYATLRHITLFWSLRKARI